MRHAVVARRYNNASVKVKLENKVMGIKGNEVMGVLGRGLACQHVKHCSERVARATYFQSIRAGCACYTHAYKTQVRSTHIDVVKKEDERRRKEDQKQLEFSSREIKGQYS